MKRFLLSAALWCGALAYPALAGTGTITVKDGGGVTRTFDIVTDGSGNFIGMQVVCDQSAAANCAGVDSSHRLSVTVDNIAGSLTLGTVTTLTGGAVASAAADSGNPVKVGGKYNLTPPTLTDGNRGDLQLDANGYVKVNVAAGGAAGGTSSNFGSAFPTPGTALGVSNGTNMVALSSSPSTGATVAPATTLLRTMSGASWGTQTTWTTGTAQNTNLVIYCGDNAQGVVVDLLGSGTITTGVITWQYSADATDCSGTTGAWASLPVSNILNPYTLASSTNPLTLTAAQSQYLIIPANVRAVRARLTTAITGSGGQVIITPTVGSQNPAITGIVNPTAISQTTPGTTNGVQTLAGSVTALSAAETHAGEVGGNLLKVSNAMTTSNNSITTGKSIGGLQTLASMARVSGSAGASGTSGLIQSVVVTFKDAVAGTSLDVYFFDANPTGSTCTDNTTFALVDADRDKVIGVVHVTDFTSGGTPVTSQAFNLAIPYGLSSATSVYACVVARGTFATLSTANASLNVRALRN